MKRNQIAKSLTVIAAVGFAATAALHGSAFGSIDRLAAQGSSDIQRILPPLWLAFSIDLTVLGLILGVVGFIPVGGARFIVAIAGLCPLGGAVLQLVFIGFVPPTAILLGLAAITAGAAVLNPENRLTN